MNNTNDILYKYRSFDARTLSIFINEELYFAKPEFLNDPHDCQISIPAAIIKAVDKAKNNKKWAISDEKIEVLEELLTMSEKIEEDSKEAGILSLSRTCKDVLMWTHYADQHRGLCIGFHLSDGFWKGGDQIYGALDCNYVATNPFLKIIHDMGVEESLLHGKDLYAWVLVNGLVAKHKCWEYEQEVRVIRKKGGKESFSPGEMVEIVFGLNMDENDKRTVMRLLCGPKWQHVKFSKMTKPDGSFGLRKVDLTASERLLPFSCPK